ncbi:MAG: head GIN domain-containing protein [Saprospiraceae bacterium]
MKNLKMYSVILLAMILMTSCQDRGNNGLFNCIEGEGDVVTQELLINEFTGVKSRGTSQVYITQGNDFKVEVTGQENIIANIETDIKNGIWEIEFDECQRNFTDLRIYITMPVIERLEISGSGDMFGQDVFAVENIHLKVDGSGSIDVAVDGATDVDARISGSGKIKLAGTTNYLGSKISGSGDLEAYDLEANIANIKISGSGDAEVSVNDELDVKIEGSGDVYYKGNPIINVDITGSGDLKNMN